jgi:hypothetical protein
MPLLRQTATMHIIFYTQSVPVALFTPKHVHQTCGAYFSGVDVRLRFVDAFCKELTIYMSGNGECMSAGSCIVQDPACVSYHQMMDTGFANIFT